MGKVRNGFSGREPREERLSGHSVTCVVVDDHPALLEAIANVLEAHGIELLGRASDGETGLALIRERRPDVAVVDIRMPQLTGIDVAREVGSEEAVTALTALGVRYGQGHYFGQPAPVRP
jgi:CheY-like chemotaxis protein